MDPDAVWQAVCEALQDLKQDPGNTETRQHAIDGLQLLASWLRIGGFPPQKIP